jgi:hypothetical protein
MVLPYFLLEPGDILGFNRPHKLSQGFIAAIQAAGAALKFAAGATVITPANVTVHHVGIVTKKATASEDGWYVDATGNDNIELRWTRSLKPSDICFFRCSDTAVAKEAARVAHRWAAVFTGVKYAPGKAVASAFRPSFYGPLAARLADHYEKHKDSKTLPDLKFGSNPDMFCTTLVIACYQAALGWKRSAKLMAKDATNTLPGTLAQYLALHPCWEKYSFKPIALNAIAPMAGNAPPDIGPS